MKGKLRVGEWWEYVRGLRKHQVKDTMNMMVWETMPTMPTQIGMQEKMH